MLLFLSLARSTNSLSVYPLPIPCATDSYLTVSTAGEMGVIRQFLHALSRANIKRLHIQTNYGVAENLVQFPLPWVYNFLNESPENFSCLETLDVDCPGLELSSEDEFYQAIKEIKRRDRDNLKTLLIRGFLKYL